MVGPGVGSGTDPSGGTDGEGDLSEIFGSIG